MPAAPTVGRKRSVFDKQALPSPTSIYCKAIYGPHIQSGQRETSALSRTQHDFWVHVFRSEPKEQTASKTDRNRTSRKGSTA